MSKKIYTYTAEQGAAIESLLTDLDELENKPRRLFHALEELALAFEKTEAIPCIREAQDITYKHINEGETYSELFNSLREFKIEEWKWQIEKSPDSIEQSDTMISGAEAFVKKHIKRLTERRFY